MHDARQHASLARAIQAMVLSHPALSVEQLCEEAFGEGKSHWTLYKELNPEDRTAKVGALDLVTLMRVCGSVAPLEIMAARLGHALIPLPRPCATTPELEQDLAKTTKEFSEAVLAFTRMVEDGRVQRHEFETFERELRECVGAALYWLERARTMEER